MIVPFNGNFRNSAPQFDGWKAKNGRLMPGSYPTRNRTSGIVGTRIDICARYSGDGWISVSQLLGRLLAKADLARKKSLGKNRPIADVMETQLTTLAYKWLEGVRWSFPTVCSTYTSLI